MKFAMPRQECFVSFYHKTVTLLLSVGMITPHNYGARKSVAAELGEEGTIAPPT